MNMARFNIEVIKLSDTFLFRDMLCEQYNIHIYMKLLLFFQTTFFDDEAISTFD